jgi:hypothetical protein
MNDSELDELLNKWKAPEAPKSLRENVRAGFHGRLKRTGRWWGKGLIATAAALAFFVVMTKAAPQKGRLGMLLDTRDTRHPFTVLSEFTRHAKDGSSRIEMFSTEYNDQEGQEHILARYIPDNMVHDRIAWMVDAVSDAAHPIGLYLLRLTPHGSETVATRATVGAIHAVTTECAGESCISLSQLLLPESAGNPGTGCAEGEATDRDTILDYATVATQLPLDGNRVRRTVWMAPALACFAMKVETEQQQADGNFRLVSSKQAIKVRLNP